MLFLPSDSIVVHHSVIVEKPTGSAIAASVPSATEAFDDTEAPFAAKGKAAVNEHFIGCIRLGC